MRHVVTLIQFLDEKALIFWGVKYHYNEDGEYEVRIFSDGILYHKFDRIPPTKAKHPNKSQALELIRIAKKLNK